MHIGLIGGIGPAATDVYYRGLVTAARRTGQSLELTVAHADAPTLLAHLEAGCTSAQCAIFEKLAHRLASAGAECVAVSAVAGHFCIDAFKAVSHLPVVDLIEAVSQHLLRLGIDHVGILGTRAVMASGFYGKLEGTRIASLGDVERQKVHDAYVGLAETGCATPEMFKVFVAAASELRAQGAQTILLGGTDLAAIFSEQTAPFPVLDCAHIHINAIMEYAAAKRITSRPNRTGETR